MSNKLIQLIKIDRRSTAPIANQIHASIKFLILSEKAKFKDTLPRVVELAAHLDVDVHDVAESYHMLVVDRMIRIDDNGVAIVEFYELTDTIARQAITFFDAIKAIGMKPSVECIEQEIRVVDETFARISGLPEGESTFFFKRVFYGDGRPFCQIEQSIRLSVVPDFARDFRPELATYTYYQNIGLKIASIARSMSAIFFPRDVCERMGERRNAAGLRSIQRVRDTADQLIEYSVSYLRSTYFQPFTTYVSK